MDKKLAEAVERQISGYDAYYGGEIEALKQQVDMLQQTVGVMCALLHSKWVVTVSELDQNLPSFGYPTIAQDMAEEEEEDLA